MKHTVFCVDSGYLWFHVLYSVCVCVCGGQAGVGGGWWQPLWTMIGSWVCSMGVGTTVTYSHVCRCSRRVLCRNRQWKKKCFIPFGAMFFSQMQNVYMYYINPSVHIHPGIYTHSKSKTPFIKGDLLYPLYSQLSRFILKHLEILPLSSSTDWNKPFKLYFHIKPLQLGHQWQEWKERMKQKKLKPKTVCHDF